MPSTLFVDDVRHAARLRLRARLGRDDSGVVALSETARRVALRSPQRLVEPTRLDAKPAAPSRLAPPTTVLVAITIALFATLCTLGALTLSTPPVTHVVERAMGRVDHQAAATNTETLKPKAKRKAKSEAKQRSDDDKAKRRRANARRRAVKERRASKKRRTSKGRRASRKSRRRQTSRDRPSDDRSQRDESPTRSDIPSADCLLNPQSCARIEAPSRPKKRKSPPSTAPKPDPKPKLQDKPTPAALKAALTTVKGLAKRCDRSPQSKGRTIRVQLSITGRTGRVKSATALGPYSADVGRCVAKALARARFPQFAAPSIGIIYTVRL